MIFVYGILVSQCVFEKVSGFPLRPKGIVNNNTSRNNCYYNRDIVLRPLKILSPTRGFVKMPAQRDEQYETFWIISSTFIIMMLSYGENISQVFKKPFDLRFTTNHHPFPRHLRKIRLEIVARARYLTLLTERKKNVRWKIVPVSLSPLNAFEYISH